MKFLFFNLQLWIPKLDSMLSSSEFFFYVIKPCPYKDWNIYFFGEADNFFLGLIDCTFIRKLLAFRPTSFLLRDLPLS